jgi:hypothetical protein
MPSSPHRLRAVPDCPGSPQEGPAPAAERVSRAAERRGREEPVDPPGQSADRSSEASQRAAGRAAMLSACGRCEFCPVVRRVVPDRPSAVAITPRGDWQAGTTPIPTNVAVRIDAVPFTVQEHECRGIIAPGSDCVHGTDLRLCTHAAIGRTKPMEGRRDYSCAGAAGSRC